MINIANGLIVAQVASADILQGFVEQLEAEVGGQLPTEGMINVIYIYLQIKINLINL